MFEVWEGTLKGVHEGPGDRGQLAPVRVGQSNHSLVPPAPAAGSVNYLRPRCRLAAAGRRGRLLFSNRWEKRSKRGGAREESGRG